MKPEAPKEITGPEEQQDTEALARDIIDSLGLGPEVPTPKQTVPKSVPPEDGSLAGIGRIFSRRNRLVGFADGLSIESGTPEEAPKNVEPK